MRNIHLKMLAITAALCLIVGSPVLNAQGEGEGTMPCPNYCDNTEQQPLCCENPLGEKFFGVIIHEGNPTLPAIPGE